MRRELTLGERLQCAVDSIQAARVHTGELTVSREDLRDAVRALADALEDLAENYRLTHYDDLRWRTPPSR